MSPRAVRPRPHDHVVEHVQHAGMQRQGQVAPAGTVIGEDRLVQSPLLREPRAHGALFPRGTSGSVREAPRDPAQGGTQLDYGLASRLLAATDVASGDGPMLARDAAVAAWSHRFVCCSSSACVHALPASFQSCTSKACVPASADIDESKKRVRTFRFRPDRTH